MKILIGEDEVLIAEHLRDIVKSFDFEVVGIGHNKEEIIRLIDKTKPDIALLDIRMKGKNDGIEIGEYIMQNYNFPIIYITAHSDTEIVQKALKTKPSGYIIKPFKSMDVFTAINIATDQYRSKKNDNFIMIKDGYKTIKLFLYEILYIKSFNNYIEIYTKRKKYLERNSLENIFNTIDSEDFRQVHRSYVVNLNYTKELTTQKLLIEEDEIPVSRKYYKELKQFLFNKNS